MAVIPTFSSYAQTPNLAQAYLGGQEIQVARERIAQQAAEAASRIALGRQQLQAEQVANEMEWSAKKDIAAREALQRAQEFEIEKAYRQTQLGMAQRNLEQEDLSLKLKLADAATQFEREAKWRREFPIRTEAGIKSGLTPQEAQSAAARSLMLELGGTGVATALNPPSPPKEQMFDVVTSFDVYGSPAAKLRLTGPQALTAMDRMTPELQAANAPLRSILQPPTSITGTNAPGGATNALKILSIRRRQ